MRGSAVVVAEQDFGLIGERADDGDLDARRFSAAERRRSSAAPSIRWRACAPGRDARGCRASFSSILVYGTISGGSNMPSLHARGDRAASAAMSMSLSLRIALLDGVEIGLVVVIVVTLTMKVDALVVHAALEADGRGLGLRGLEVMAAIDVDAPRRSRRRRSP